MRVLSILLICALALPVAADPKEKAAAHYRQGKAYLDAQQYDQAIAEFEAAYAIDKVPSHLFNIGKAYDAKAAHDKAIEYYRRYLDAEPKSPRAAEVRALIVTATKARDDERTRIEAAKKKEEEAKAAATARVKQAEAYARAGAWGDAGNEYLAAFAIDANPAYLLAAAEAFRKAPALAKARDAYAAYLEKVPQGGESDAVRTKLAETTRAIEQAAEPKPRVEDVKDPPKPPPEPIDATVANFATNAKDAAARGDCDVARALANRVKDRDPVYYEGVVVASLGACTKSSSGPSGRVGGGASIQLGILSVGVTNASNQDTAYNMRGAGFVHVAVRPSLRLRLGATAVKILAEFSGPCADTCPQSIGSVLVGPEVALEPMPYRDKGRDFHFVLGAAYLIPFAQHYDLRTMTSRFDGAELKSQIALQIGAGVRFGGVSFELIGLVMPGNLSDGPLEVGGSKTLSIAIGWSSLR